MIQLDVSNAELVTLHRNDNNVEVIVSFSDCPNVVLRTQNLTDMILIKLTIVGIEKPEPIDIHADLPKP